MALVINHGSTPVGIKTGTVEGKHDAVDITFNPGLNKVDDKDLAEARKHKTFDAHFTADVRLHHPTTGDFVRLGKRLEVAAVEPKAEAKAPATDDGKGKAPEKK